MLIPSRLFCVDKLGIQLDAIARLRIVKPTVFSPTHDPINIHCDLSADCLVVVSRR